MPTGSYAQVYRTLQRESFLRQQPGEWRAAASEER